MANNNNADVFQLDAFNYLTGVYDVVEVRSNAHELSECAKLLGLKAWRIWNRTERGNRDRLLPPTPRIVKTTNHSRRFSLVHRAPKNAPTNYKRYSA